MPLSEVIGERPSKVKGKQPDSILLDKDERELVKKGDQVTKAEMWDLLESKRFQKL